MRGDRPRPPIVWRSRWLASATRADGSAPILNISSLRFDASYRRHPGLSANAQPSNRTIVSCAGTAPLTHGCQSTEMRLTTTPNAQRQRARAIYLAIAVGLAGLLPQQCVQTSHLKTFGLAHIDLDNSLRVAAMGRFNSADEVPVTIVDIDEATQAAWHHPLATPRVDLLRMIRVVEAAKPAAI